MTATPGFDKPLIFAHRGMPRLAPENTISSFQAAVPYTSWVELDVDIISDGTPIVIHDTMLDRTTDHKGSMYQLTSADLPHIDAGSWFSSRFTGEPLPTLREVMITLDSHGLNANVELKANEQGASASIREIEAVLEVLRDFQGEIIVSSFSSVLLAEFHRRAPQYRTGLLFESATIRHDWFSQAQLCGAHYIHPEDKNLTEQMVQTVRKAGMGVNVWTVNNPARAAELFSWGATGIFTDTADTITDQLQLPSR